MSECIDAIVKICQDHDYLYHFGECETEDPAVVLVGENHDPNDLSAQEELIGIVKPKIIYHEVFQKYDKKTSRTSDGKEIPYDPSHVRRISEWKSLFGIPVKRLDVSKTLRKRIDNQVISLFDLVDQPDSLATSLVYSDLVDKIREVVMVGIIGKEIRKKRIPFFGVVGSGHISPLALLPNYLFHNKIPYAVICQTRDIKDYLDYAKPYFVRP